MRSIVSAAVQGVLAKLAARAVPPAWRATVVRVLADEASRNGRGQVWFFWHALRVAFRLRLRRPVHQGSGPMAPSAGTGWVGDLRMAVRNILRQPMQTAAIVVTVALGVAATTATFGVFNLVVFRPVPGVTSADRIVSLYVQQDAVTPSRTSASFAHFTALRDNVPALEDLAAWGIDEVPFSAVSSAPRDLIPVVRVTSAYFDALGARARLGRLPSGTLPDAYADPVLTISERFWRQRLSADPAVIGR